MIAGSPPVIGPILVVGDIVTDVMAAVAEPITHASDTAASISMTGGGAGANTAAWLAYLGAPVTLCGVVGADPDGVARVSELKAAGVRCVVRIDPTASTGAVVVIAERFERTMLADRGANLRLTPDDIDAALDRAQPVHLHLSGYALLDADSRPAAEHALRAAHARGLTTSVDAASAGPLRRAPGFMEWVRGTDLLFANRDEARVLAAGRFEADVDVPGETLAAELAHTVNVAVIKLGAGGAVAVNRGFVTTADALNVEVIDATGAGDAFAAGFLAVWLAERDVLPALHAGVKLGAQAVTSIGARPAYRP